MPELRLDARLAQWVVQALTRLLATYAILQGVFIVLGGRERWTGRSLATALLLPGAPASWGVVLAFFGVLCLLGTFTTRMTLTAAGAFGIGAWSIFFAASQLITFFQAPNVPTTGIFTYSHLAVSACVLAWLYWKSRR
jgi:hypothetical protein